MEYGIWSLHVAGELWRDPRLARRHHPILPPYVCQITPRTALTLNVLCQSTTNMVPLPLALNGPSPYGPIGLVTKSSGSNNDLELAKDDTNEVYHEENDDGGDDNEVNEDNIEKSDDNENQVGKTLSKRKKERKRERKKEEENKKKEQTNKQTNILHIIQTSSEQIETNENEEDEESDTGSTGSSRKSSNNNFPTKLLDPMSCLGLDKEGAVSPVLNGWVLGAYTAMLGRLSAATAALEATQIPNIPSDSDSESEHSSYTERSRGSSPNVSNVHRGYSCGSCDVVAPTRPALRKHIANCHPTLNGTEMRESRSCPAPGCDFTTNSRCEMETHVAAHVAQGMTPTGKKRTLALQRVRYRYEREEYRCTLCSYACTIEKAFQRHLRAHARGTAPETRVSCAVCGADRSSEVDLSRHMRRHRDDRYFCCDICIFRTVQLKKLIQHRRMHTGEKPHLCPHCAYRSARRDNLRSHVRRVHKKENLYCDTFSPRGMLIAPTINDKDDSIVVQTPASSPSSNPDSTN
ncbi:B-cell CLL/lymphoma 6 member B protein-like isoform X1 [Vespa velutina]|uniref:B-cell CLL/lymphoma 6 member B protein-like isoform X1 n=1 Tax=Vespa velutina TaxID=202808 RepID=UPI001FB32D1B|nr:B-cell CLL/lymphoma 6 member B protein-like isoform X1 [Vespa velutina]XP_047370164.1 B-cell CLL/lymphoma 6 member B protein-like isoform X1 [Vespa velutina]XP_047370165.1 B-cell CLL/lymphoma 6 member B protein-like isoform X1 [Vespa velutina]XP_047370166.1 B-cell CLL/lymphoma 6 member B protein-like isoform X1 [Vespa velutina]XP_047370167.1 B-cell CLL/lymphoma 6 member B protein-like isoform X1 [Vespa velutina]XP_047370168.1 B-cell CLL/lymphoma 6 member B protein-like isoform X1 [Vespa vel